MGATTRIVRQARTSTVRTSGFSIERAAAIVADHHRKSVAEAQRQNAEVLGYVPTSTTWVNGVESDWLEEVRPGQAIITKYDLTSDMLKWIWDLLVTAAPHLTGAFQRSIRIFADDVEVETAEAASAAKEVVFTSLAPYARKIERGESAQAPDGLFEGVAALASARYRNQVKIRFSYRNPVGGAVGEWAAGRAARRGPGKRQIARDTRQPAIVVTLA